MVNDLMSALIKVSKEGKTSSKKRRDEADVSQIPFIRDIENREAIDISVESDSKNNEFLLSQYSFEQQDLLSKINQVAQIVSDKDRTISDLTKVVSEQKSQINHLETQVKEAVQKNTMKNSEEPRVLSISTSQIVEVPQVHKALVVSDPTDISVKKSVVSLSESPLSHNSVPSIPRVTPALTIESQGMQFLDPRKPRLLEEDLFSHTILFPRPKFEMEKRSISLDPLLAEYTTSKLFTEKIPEEHFFVDERITTSIDPFIPQFESGRLKMEKAHTLVEPKVNEFEAIKGDITGIDIQKNEFSEEKMETGVDSKSSFFEAATTFMDKAHTLVETKIHDLVSVITHSMGITPEPNDKNYTLTKHPVEQTAIPFKRKLEIEEKVTESVVDSEVQGFTFNNYGNHVEDGNNSTNHSRKTTIIVDRDNNNNDVIMTGHSASPSIDMGVNNDQHPYDLTLLDNVVIRKKERAHSLGNINHAMRKNQSQSNVEDIIRDHLIADVNKTLEENDNAREIYRKRLSDLEHLYVEKAHQLSIQLKMNEQLSNQNEEYEQQHIQLFGVLKQENDEAVSAHQRLESMQKKLDTKDCEHCREASHYMNLVSQQNDDLEYELDHLKEQINKIGKELKEKESKINTLISRLHFNEERLLEVENDNIHLSQENAFHSHTLKEYEDTFLSLTNRAKLAEDTNQKYEDELFKLYNLNQNRLFQNLNVQDEDNELIINARPRLKRSMSDTSYLIEVGAN
jgi:hypothetical protein